MTVQFSAGRFTLTTPRTTLYLTRSQLVTLLRFFDITPHFDSMELLAEIANATFNDHIAWFEQWDSLESFQHYTTADWENLLDACDPPKLHVGPIDPSLVTASLGSN